MNCKCVQEHQGGHWGLCEARWREATGHRTSQARVSLQALLRVWGPHTSEGSSCWNLYCRVGWALGASFVLDSSLRNCEVLGF